MVSPATAYQRPRFDPQAPLAVRMRPINLDEVVGQTHLLGPGAPLRRLVEGGSPSSMLLYGPPGTGKTTLATLVAGATGRRFSQLSALSAGVKEVRAVITDASNALRRTGEQTVLFIDEVHRFSKTQQDSLLGAVENRTVILIAATTENPFFSVVSPLLSRSLVLQLQPLTDDEIGDLLDRAVVDERGLAGALVLDPAARAHVLALAGGDARRALTALEAAADSVQNENGTVIDLTAVERAVNRAAVRYDRDGDQHYDVTSAFIKSIRGSDVDAALHYLARMLEAGEDPRFIARRLMIHASEDIGMADPTALPVCVAAAQVVQLVGLPEARIGLAQATIHLATAAKSNSVVMAIDAAITDVRSGRIGSVPPSLRDGHYPGAAQLGNAQHYVYPPDVPGGVAQQQYPPDELVGRDYYTPVGRGAERPVAERLPLIRRAIRGGPAARADDDKGGRGLEKDPQKGPENDPQKDPDKTAKKERN
ncbi:replication-associated recombination protein A [Nakamurella sp. UYEF19]|uniref:replication-associated recombination protein A n=1 Tax=Nakamurella sp. UYEF19 TaxID=1756392 RepID=UPI00339A1BCE